MRKSQKQNFTPSRRKFLGGMATASALIMVGCGNESFVEDDAVDGDIISDGDIEKDGDSIVWDEEFDVLIVGAGGAGLVAALEAATNGASVIVLEKAKTIGGSTSYSGGVIQGSGTSVQDDYGISNDTAEKHFKYWKAAGEGIPEEKLIRTMANNSADDIEWLISHGLSFSRVYAVDTIPYIDRDLMPPRLHEVEGGAGAYVNKLEAEAEAAGVTIRTETPAIALVKDVEQGIVGLKASDGTTETNIRALKGVILTSGGFDRNEEMARSFSPQHYNDLQGSLVLTPQANVGDGLVMGLAAGADLAGLGGTLAYPSVRIGRKEGEQLYPGIWVNKYGQRFVNETAHYGYAARAIFNQEQHMVYAIFDQTTRDLIGGTTEYTNGSTLAELAKKIEVNAGQLELTVDKWNEDVENNEDTLFGKEVGLATIENPDYYASEVQEFNIGSLGGLKINTKAEVIDKEGEAIAGLYAAGMVAGGYIGPYYPGSGTAINATLVFGRIAGREAAAR